MKNIFHLCVITCPSSCVLWENIPDWFAAPSSAADVWAVFLLPGQDATERFPVVEAPADMHGLHWPPEHTHRNKLWWHSSHILLYSITEEKKKLCYSVLSARKSIHIVCVPVGHLVENLRGSFLPGACQDDGCAESPGSQCRCQEQETELSGPHVEVVLPLCDSTAAVAP